MTRLAIFAFGYVAGLVVAGLLLIVASYREERPRTASRYVEDDDGVQAP